MPLESLTISTPAAAGTVLWLITWYLLGFVGYALVFAAVGALVSRQEDVAGRDHAGTHVRDRRVRAGRVDPARRSRQQPGRPLSMIPMFAPTLMPMRLAMGGVPAWQVAVAVAGVLVLIPLLVGCPAGSTATRYPRRRPGEAARRLAHGLASAPTAASADPRRAAVRTNVASVRSGATGAGVHPVRRPVTGPPDRGSGRTAPVGRRRGSRRSRPPEPAGTALADRVPTIPNMISFARLLGVPLFLWLYLVPTGPHRGGGARLGGTSDWVDGYLARRLNQVSRLGELMDPLADRLYILATVIAFTIGAWCPGCSPRRCCPGRCMVGCLLVLRRSGYAPPPVHYLGKTATFILLFAFPTLLLATRCARGDLLLRQRLGTGLVGPRALLGGRRVLPHPDRRCGTGARGSGSRSGRLGAAVGSGPEPAVRG